MANDDFDPYEHWLGIEPSEHPVDHYRLLGIARFEGDLVKITVAADERMQRVRTYQTGPRGIYTQRLLNELSAAKLRLLDPVSKQQYDERLRAGPSEDSDFMLKLGEAVLPPGLDTETTTKPDPMAPLVVPSQPPVATSGPMIRIETAGKGRATSGKRGSAAAGSSSPEVTSPKVRVPQGVVGHLLVFLTGVVGVAAFVWFVGSLYFKDGSGLGSAEISNGSQRLDGGGGLPSSSSARILQKPDGSFSLSGENAWIQGSSARVVPDETGTTVRDWVRSDDKLHWRVVVERGTMFQAHLTYSVGDLAAGGSIRITFGDQTKDWDLRASGGVDSFITDEIPIGVAKPGEHTLTLEATNKPGREVMRFRSLELKPYRGAKY